MGFFGALGKVLRGKPVFEPQHGVQQGATPSPANPENPASDPKQIPVVQIRRVETHDDGGNTDIYVDIHNDSSGDIMLDNMLVLDTKRELDTTLRSGEARQFHVFSGPRTIVEPHGYAELQYRTVDGDYFASIHRIRSRQEQDHTWSVTEFLLQPPIRDLH